MLQRSSRRSSAETSTFRSQRRGAAVRAHDTSGVFIDPDLLQYDEVWAAAGTWHAVFALSPTDLERVSGGTVTDLKR
jgi:prolyl-tRNA editing enzyme YbaK/EbsC (Cys-tRNA(Pro) deacylase)